MSAPSRPPFVNSGARTFDPPIERPANRTRPPPTVSGGLTIPAPPLGNGSSISTPVNPVAPASIPPPGGNERLQQLRAEMNALAQQRRAEAPALAQAAQPRPTEAVTSSTATAAALVTASAAPKPLSRQQVPPSPLDRLIAWRDAVWSSLTRAIKRFFSLIFAIPSAIYQHLTNFRFLTRLLLLAGSVVAAYQLGLWRATQPKDANRTQLLLALSPSWFRPTLENWLSSSTAQSDHEIVSAQPIATQSRAAAHVQAKVDVEPCSACRQLSARSEVSHYARLESLLETRFERLRTRVRHLQAAATAASGQLAAEAPEDEMLVTASSAVDSPPASSTPKDAAIMRSPRHSLRGEDGDPTAPVARRSLVMSLMDATSAEVASMPCASASTPPIVPATPSSPPPPPIDWNRRLRTVLRDRNLLAMERGGPYTTVEVLNLLVFEELETTISENISLQRRLTALTHHRQSLMSVDAQLLQQQLIAAGVIVPPSYNVGTMGAMMGARPEAVTQAYLASLAEDEEEEEDSDDDI